MKKRSMTRGDVRRRVIDELAAWVDDQPERDVRRDEIDDLELSLDDACESCGDELELAAKEGINRG